MCNWQMAKECSSSEGLYLCDVTGFQAANSFLQTVRPLELEMIYQLLNVKFCWTDKLTKQFRPPFPDQAAENAIYQLYLRRPATKEEVPLLVWLHNHTTTRDKSKPLQDDKYLVSVKFVSVFNPVFFFQHFLVLHPHCHPQGLRHSEELSMLESVKFTFSALDFMCSVT